MVADGAIVLTHGAKVACDQTWPHGQANSPSAFRSDRDRRWRRAASYPWLTIHLNELAFYTEARIPDPKKDDCPALHGKLLRR